MEVSEVMKSVKVIFFLVFLLRSLDFLPGFLRRGLVDET